MAGTQPGTWEWLRPRGQAHQVQNGGQDPVHRAHLLRAEADHPHGLGHRLVGTPLVVVRGLEEKGLSTPARVQTLHLPPPWPPTPALNACGMGVPAAPQPWAPQTCRGPRTHTEPCALAGEVVQGGVSLQVQLLQLTVLTALQHLQDRGLGQAPPTQAGRTDAPTPPPRWAPPTEGALLGAGGHCWRAGRAHFGGLTWCGHRMSPENSLPSPGGRHVWVRQGADTAVSGGTHSRGWGRGGRKWAVGTSEGPSGLPRLPTLAHLIEGVEVPFPHMLLEDPRLRREGQLGPWLGGAEPPQTGPRAPGRVGSGVAGLATEEPHPLNRGRQRGCIPAPRAQAGEGGPSGPTFSSR